MTSRTTAFPSGSKLKLGIPFMSLDHELIYEYALDHFVNARKSVVAAITPAPTEG